MPGNIKALIVVLGIALLVFYFAEPVALRFGSKVDFARRRNVWLVLTATAFLSPSFWLFLLVAAPLLVWAGRKDSHPVALYMLLVHVIPPFPIDIPVIGIRQLFSLDIYRVLSLCVLIPTAWRMKNRTYPDRIRGLSATDFAILAFGLWQLLNYVPPDLPDHSILPDSPTNVLRRAVLFFIDVYFVYFVVSRACNSRRALADSLGAFALGCAIMAVVAVFETFRNWLLYVNLSDQWGLHSTYGSQYAVYFVRGGFLRAGASTGNSLVLGYFLAIAFGFWLYLKSHVESAWRRSTVAMLFWVGMMAAQARGPMIGALAMYFAFSMLGPRAVSRVLKAAGVVVLLVAAVSATTFGEQIIKSIPFFSTSTQAESVAYRERLAERSWELIQLHPFLGDRLALTKMEDLRQGEGIIDLVNTYATVTLFYGGLGLLLFLAVIVVAVFKVYRVGKENARRDPDFALLGLSLLACLIGALLIIATMSFVAGTEQLFYMLVGLAAAYAYLGTPERR